MYKFKESKKQKEKMREKIFIEILKYQNHIIIATTNNKNKSTYDFHIAPAYIFLVVGTMCGIAFIQFK